MTATLGSHRLPLALFRQFQNGSVAVEDPLRKVATQAPGVVCQFRWKGSLTVPFIAPNCRRMFGLTAIEIQADARSLIDLIHPDDIGSFWESLEYSIHTLQTWHWQGQFYRSLSTLTTVHLAAEPEVQPTGEIVWNGFLIQISSYVQRTETQLRESRQRLRLLIQQAPIAIIQWNTQFEVQKWNPAAERTFGYKQQEVIGQHLGFLLPDEVRTNVLQQFTSLLTQSGVAQSIHGSMTKQGENIVCEWYNYPLLAPNGTLISIVSMVIDISDRKQAEQELHKRAEQLQLTLQELRHTQAQLIQSEKMSSLGQLVAGVAHEINNPVSFIAGNIPYAKQYAETLLAVLEHYQQQEPEEPSQLAEDFDLAFVQQDFPKILDSMQTGVQRIRDIVLSLRNFSRLDEAESKTVDIHEGIDSTLMMLQSRLKSEVDVIKNYGALPKVECYPGQLNQVFMNILVNAIDVLQECKMPTIWISTAVVENQVQIRIADNGGGMTAEVCDRVFDPFFTTKPVGKGTGLGLSISYQIVTEKHQGSLRCQSEVGQGTEFVIEIPVLRLAQGKEQTKKCEIIA